MNQPSILHCCTEELTPRLWKRLLLIFKDVITFLHLQLELSFANIGICMYVRISVYSIGNTDLFECTL
jgi:hypothetical protein